MTPFREHLLKIYTAKKKKKKKTCVIKLNLQVIFEKVEEEKPILLVLM